MKYTHKFNQNLTCTVEIIDRKIKPGERHIIRSEWSQKPKKKHIPEYVRWMHVVNDTYAKEHGLRLMHVYQLSPKYNDWQIWGYSPDAPPCRLEMPNLPGGPQNLDALNQSLTEDLQKESISSMTLDHRTAE
jgi:hypothetical protein